MEIPAVLNDNFSSRAFLQGLAVSAAAFILTWVAVIVMANNTVKQLESSLNSRTVIVDNLNYQIEEQKIASSKEESPGLLPMKDEKPPTMDEIKSYKPIKNRKALYPAPINGLFDRSPLGPIPKISDNNIYPFDAYKKPFKPTGKPVIAIGILDFGLRESLAERILYSIPGNATLILSPYADASKKWPQKARENGFETWLQIPTETENFLNKDTGTKGIVSSANLKDNKENMNWLLTRGSGYAGVALETDVILNRSKPILNLLKKDIFKRGLGFFEINAEAPILLETIALQENKPYIKNQYSLNDTSFKNIEKTAREKGHAVAIIKPYPNAIRALQTWSETLEAKGFTLAPISAIPNVKLIK